MIDALRLKQLILFGLLAVISYSVYERFYNRDGGEQYKPFTKGYALTGVIIKSTDETGVVVTTVKSPAITHYADTEETIIDQPHITLHDSVGDWVFTSDTGKINADKTTIYFPEQVNVDLAAAADSAVGITTRSLWVDVVEKQGKTESELVLKQVGSLLKGLGAVIDFNQQEIEILSEMYAEFEN